MKQLWAVALVSLLLVLAGCSSNSASSSKETGESLYAGKCAACHGGNLKGQVGPPLLNIGSKYSEDQLVKIITKGTANMPGNLLSEDQAKTVAAWLLKK